MDKFLTTPPGWKKKKLSELGRIVTGSTPKTEEEKNWLGTLPFVSPTDINRTKYIYSTKRYVNKSVINDNRIIPKDSVMYTSIASIGKIAISSMECTTNQQINSILPNKGYNPNFLYYSLLYKSDYIKTLAGTTAVPIINKSLFSKIELIIPVLKEQQKIAAILSSVDEAIEKTERIIEKTKIVKRGLMQELLTKGIGHTEFKDSPVSQIPKSWNIVKIKDIFNTIDGDRGKNYPGQSDFKENGYCLFLNTKNVTSNGFCFSNIKFINKTKDDELKNGKLIRNDIVMTSRGTLGNIAYYSDEIPFDNVRINSAMLILRSKNNIIHNFWIYLLKGKIISQYIAKYKVGSAQPHITKKSFNNLLIPFPSLEEQEKIADILNNVDEKINKEQSRLDSLNALKKGLMQQLLTGKTRVTIDN
ncbi:restriction endonuclease subunit S [Salinicoccus jeotgali]|uniref:Restriction endonuclease subunit S n=1 Tax=Salinicoccus jeotgali TaxID=381634 RepID=A0ABP7ENZ3_9STAP